MPIAAVATGALRIGSMFARGVGKGGGLLRKAVLKKTKVKRENIAKNKVFNKKLIERRRRREKETLLETFKTRGKSGISQAQVPGKGILDRALEFIGVLLIGWLADKLPQIIAWVKDLIIRIKLFVSSLKNFIKNLGNWFNGIGSYLNGFRKNLSEFDFTDKSGRMKKAMEDMEKALKGMENDVKNLKTAVGGEMGDVYADTGETIPLGKGETAKGSQLMNGLIRRGFSKEEAAAIVGNLYAESTFRTGAQNPKSGAFGLMQWAYGRKDTLLRRAREAGKSPTDIEFQLDHIAWELRGGSSYETSQFKKAMSYGTSVASKTRGFANEVERASAYELQGSMSKRIGAAQSVYGQGGAGDGRISRGPNQTPAYQRAVNVGRALEGQGYRAWQHPDFNIHSGYTGSGRERVMRRSYNSYHNYGEALDYPLSHNSEAQLDKLASYFRQNKAALGVAEVIWRSAGHYDHLHVSFKGGGSVDRMPIADNMDMGAGVGQPQNLFIILEEEAPPPIMMGGPGGSSPVVVMGASLNSIIKRHLLTSLAYN